MQPAFGATSRLVAGVRRDDPTWSSVAQGAGMNRHSAEGTTRQCCYVRPLFQRIYTSVEYRCQSGHQVELRRHEHDLSRCALTQSHLWMHQPRGDDFLAAIRRWKSFELVTSAKAEGRRNVQERHVELCLVSPVKGRLRKSISAVQHERVPGLGGRRGPSCEWHQRRHVRDKLVFGEEVLKQFSSAVHVFTRCIQIFVGRICPCTGRCK